MRDSENTDHVHDGAAQKLLQLEVLPFSSPIAAQLQTVQLHELLTAEIKPLTMINGTLALELPSNHVIRLPVRLRYDDVAKYLTTLNNGSINAMRQGTTESTTTTTWLRQADQKTDVIKTVDNHTGHGFAPQQSCDNTASGIATPTSFPDSIFSAKPVNSRTQEEIQAAKTILSLAHGARIPSPTIAETVFPTGQLDSPKPCQAAMPASVAEPKPKQRQQSGTTKNNRTRDQLSAELLTSIDAATACPAVSGTSQPETRLNASDLPPVAENLTNQSPNTHTDCPRGLMDSGHLNKPYSIPCAISPKHPKSPRLPIRSPPPPPPKKRVLANYRQPIPVKSLSVTSEAVPPTESGQRERHGPSSPAHKPTNPHAKPVSLAVNSAPTTSATITATDSTVISPTMLPRILSNGATPIPTVQGHMSSPNCTEPNTSPITNAAISTGAAAIVSGNSSQPSIPATPNLFILPQLMLFPRIISPYIPVSPNSGLMTPCYLVQSDGTARLASPRCAVTTSETVRPPHVSVGAFSLPSTAPQAVFAPTSNLSKTSNGGEYALLSQVDRPSRSSPRHIVSDTKCSSNESSWGASACSPRLIDSYAAHMTRNLSGPPILRPLVSREETSTSAAASSSSGRRTELRPKAISSGLGSTRLLASCRNKYRCYECGVVCHKPCLLRKHYRTHSNVRPYFCRHCDISFKTRGNLSKHMKSKGHRDRCVKELGLDQVPLVVDDQTQIDRQALERQHQLAFKREHAKRDGWRARYRTIRAKCPLRNRSSVQMSSPGTKPSLTRPIRSKKPGGLRAGVIPNSDNVIQPLVPVLHPTAISGGLELNGRIPAPNVNAVHLLQDFPLNLSTRSRQLPPSYPTEIPAGPTPGVWLGTAVPTSNGIIHPPYAPSASDTTDPEEVVRTAVAAARTLKNGSSSIDLSYDSKEASSGRPDFTGQSSVSADALGYSPTLSTPQSPSCSATVRIASSHATRFSNQSNPQTIATPTTTLCMTHCSETTSLKSLTSTTYTSPNSNNNNSSLLLLPRGLPPETFPTETPNGGNTHDPRPYKCLTCRVGFRVTGHLHKHFRAKSHLLNELHAHKLAPEVIEYVRLNRISVNQFVNPDTGRLRAKAVERIVANRSLNGGQPAPRTLPTSSADPVR